MPYGHHDERKWSSKSHPLAEYGMLVDDGWSEGEEYLVPRA
jgi:hypothetical protein